MKTKTCEISDILKNKHMLSKLLTSTIDCSCKMTVSCQRPLPATCNFPVYQKVLKILK